MPILSFRRLLLLGVLAAGVFISVIVMHGSPAGADLSTSITSNQNRAASLRAAIAYDTSRISASAHGIAVNQARLAGLQADVTRRQAQLAAVQSQLVRARDRLTRLENRVRRSTDDLRQNLVAAYRNPQPDIVSVILDSHGFQDLLERASFYKRVSHQNAEIMDAAKTSRTQVTKQANVLARVQARDASLTAAIASRRDSAQALETALLNAQAQRLAGRANKRAQLHEIRGRIASLMARQRTLQPAVVNQVVSATPNQTITTDPGGLAQAPAGAPAAVAQVIAAGNAIAGLPYLYGGGHASFQANAYDCSGSVSYALAAAGLVSSPLDSTSFESWGEPGPGKWITVYANAVHAWMIVAGWRFDTGNLPGSGTRWTRAGRSTGGFVMRHPPGL